MKKAEIERSLSKTLREAPSIDFEVLANTPVAKMQEYDYITRQEIKRSPLPLRQLALAASFCLIFIICFSTWLINFRLPFSTIYLDVNPSIEIVTNRHDQVLSVNALNEDAEKVLQDLVYKSSDLNDTVDTLLTALVRYGYLSEEKNVIMISVENNNAEKADQLAVSLDQKILDNSSQQSISLTVLRQVLEDDKEISALAAENEVSAGKMKLIQEIVSSNSTLTIDELAHMSMKNLVALSKENNVDLDKTVKFDSNSGKAETEKKNGKTEDSGKKAADSQGGVAGNGNGEFNNNSNADNSLCPQDKNSEGCSSENKANSGNTETNSGKSGLDHGHTKFKEQSAETSEPESAAGWEDTFVNQTINPKIKVKAKSGKSQSENNSEAAETWDSESQDQAGPEDSESRNDTGSESKGRDDLHETKSKNNDKRD
ncbi:hypothetical protein SDC9_55872 [bioreactor metagenome]|uniref:Anti-sigma factor RsgI-like middle domain-containing protein n=1 Tax=bioreactor metagenome TaxID=1076179 RepID=A0A644X0Y6_9ZZZZ